MIELRTYTLVDADALRRYTTEFWPRHARSLRKHDITIHGLWVDTSADGYQVVALVGYPSDGARQRVVDGYLHSSDFDEDHAGFDPGIVVAVRSAILAPIPGV